MEKINGESMDIERENIKRLKEIFPEVFTEDKIDFEKLQLILGEDIEESEERYSFNWNGKRDAIRLSQTPTTGTLRPDKDNSKNWDETENLYIEGDNLEVLKLLQKSYHGKIKMIYIDPPYNTGKDFVYKDNYRDNMKNYLEFTEQVDEEGRKLSTNTDTSGRYHTDWLNMMYPRLRLARNLLTDDGVIFISIDDNEVHNLRKICDEVFGEDNFVVNLYLQVRYDNKSLTEKDDYQKVIESVLVYKKKDFSPERPYEPYSIDKFCYSIVEKGVGEKIKLGDKIVEIFKEDQYEIKKIEPSLEGLKETWASGSVLTGNASGKFFNDYLSVRPKIDGYKVLYKVYGIGEDGLGYRYFTGPRAEKYTKGKFYSGIPLFRLNEIKTGESKKYKPIPTFYNYSADFGNISHEGNMVFRNGKKPIKLIKNLLSQVKGNDFIILDFFSGSSSTAHAVMDLNAEDGGNRKFITVQLPEPTEVNSEYRNEDLYTIADIGRERIRRAGDKILEDNKDKEGIEDLDIGFKSFKLDSSNIKEWNPEYMDKDFTMEDLVNNFVPNRNEEDILYEIILKYGIDLTAPIEEHKVNGKTIYNVGFGAIYICLDNHIDNDVVEEILKLNEENKMPNPMVVFKDTGFKNDEIKLNAKLSLNDNGIEEVVSI